MPMLADNMRQCVEFAARTAGSPPPAEEDLRVIRVKSTLRMDEMYVTPNIYEEIRNDPDVEKTAEHIPVVDTDGNLPPF